MDRYDNDPTRAALLELEQLVRRMPPERRRVLLHLCRLYAARDAAHELRGKGAAMVALDAEIATFEQGCRDFGDGIGPLPRLSNKH